MAARVGGSRLEKRFPLLDEEGWREAPGWCFQEIVLLNEPPRRFAAPRQGGEKPSSCDSTVSYNLQLTSLESRTIMYFRLNQNRNLDSSDPEVKEATSLNLRIGGQKPARHRVPR